MITDAIAEEVKDYAANTVSAVEKAKDQILSSIVESGSLFSLNKASILADAGNIGEIGSGIKKVIGVISMAHPYYPDFGYDYRDGKILSTPLTPQAKALYPPRITITGPVKFGDQYYNDSNGNLLDYAYRHQLSFMMEVQKAVKLLGEKPDPSQDEAEGLVGRTLVAEPPEFPPAFSCSIKVGEQTFFDYVLLRTQKIEDDGTYIIGNKEQGGTLYFEVKINPRLPRKTDFKIAFNQESNKEHLQYLRFMSTLSKEKEIHIYVLSKHEDLIAGNINEIKLRTGFNSIEDEIDFLERVCDIEDYFQVTILPYGKISNKEFEMIVHISDLIRNNQFISTWSEATFTGVLDRHFREELITMDGDLYGISYVGSAHTILFGIELKYRLMKTFKCARIVNFEKVKKMAEELCDGDTIKITLKAGDNNETIETLNIPENIAGSYLLKPDQIGRK